MSLQRAWLRWILVPSAAVTVALAIPGIAAAHVTVHPDHLARGATDVELTFRCPNERNDASTVRLQAFLPTATPLLGVLTQQQPGWKATTTTTTLPKPVVTDDGTVTQAVTEVNWTATAGGIGPGQYADFPIAVGSLPDVAGPIVFQVLQTYSSGEVVRWIQVPDALNPTPDTPAPILTLTSSSTAPSASATTSLAMWLAIGAVVLSCAALLVVVLLALRRRRP